MMQRQMRLISATRRKRLGSRMIDYTLRAAQLHAGHASRFEHVVRFGCGHFVIKPDFPECIHDFGFLWFESEYVIDVAVRWILAANAADAIVRSAI